MKPLKKNNKIRAVIRLCLVVFITAIYVCRIVILGMLSGFFKKKRLRNIQLWACAINRFTGVRITVTGDVPQQGTIIVSNHRSYIDITAIAASLPVSFLAKSEVGKWPLIGIGMKLNNIVFVNRKSKESRKHSLKEIAEHLIVGNSLVIFPEGTSYEGPGLLTFKPGIFKLCAENGFTLIPVAIEYEEKGDAWIGDDTFFPHFFNTFSRKSIQVKVSFGPRITGNDPAEINKRAWQWINSKLMQEKQHHEIRREQAALV